MNFKFETEGRLLSCNKDMWIKFRVLLFDKFTSQMSFWGCFKTAVKLNLLDHALNLAFDRLNLIFSIEILQV
ncbi:hypothetical protein [Campylobacter concisus]